MKGLYFFNNEFSQHLSKTKYYYHACIPLSFSAPPPLSLSSVTFKPLSYKIWHYTNILLQERFLQSTSVFTSTVWLIQYRCVPLINLFYRSVYEFPQDPKTHHHLSPVTLTRVWSISKHTFLSVLTQALLTKLKKCISTSTSSFYSFTSSNPAIIESTLNLDRG